MWTDAPVASTWTHLIHSQYASDGGSANNWSFDIALMCTALNGNYKISKPLLDFGANIDKQNNDGCTALICITGIFAHEYKKPNGSWNISKIAKDSGTTRPTVMKYLPKETLF
jgi:hypothetical protein